MVATTETYQAVDVRRLGEEPEKFSGQRVLLEGVLAEFYRSEDGPLVELQVPLGRAAWEGSERVGLILPEGTVPAPPGTRVQVRGQVIGARPVVSGYACGYSLQALIRADEISPLEPAG